MTNQYKEQIRNMVLDAQTFVRLTMKGPLRDSPWRQVIVRPVLIKNQHYLQCSYFNQKQDITKSYRGPEAGEKLDEILALPLNSISVQSTPEALTLHIPRHGTTL